MNERNWIVSIAQDDEDDEMYGPYSQATAKRIADSFNKARDRALRGPEADNSMSYLNASAYPLRRLNITTLRKDYGL